jgi:hypothetical protein
MSLWSMTLAAAGEATHVAANRSAPKDDFTCMDHSPFAIFIDGAKGAD